MSENKSKYYKREYRNQNTIKGKLNRTRSNRKAQHRKITQKIREVHDRMKVPIKVKT